MSRHREREDAALDWLIRAEEAHWTAADQAELDAWLNMSLANKAAFWRIQHGWRRADRIRALGIPSRSGPALYGGMPMGQRWLVAACLCLVLVAAVPYASSVFAPEPEPAPARYHTAIGARQLVPLADGSKIELNTATTVRASVTSAHRDIWLDAGEAYFEVAHQDGKPFVVHVGDKILTVLGTKFSVRRDQGKVTVGVLEGRVRLEDHRSPDDRGAVIGAGDLAISQNSSTLITNAVDRVESAISWRGGMLIFGQSTLLEIASEFNRYNQKPIVIEDQKTASIIVSGAFKSSNVAAFLRLVHDAYGLRVEENADRIKISG